MQPGVCAFKRICVPHCSSPWVPSFIACHRLHSDDRGMSRTIHYLSPPHRFYLLLRIVHNLRRAHVYFLLLRRNMILLRIIQIVFTAHGKCYISFIIISSLTSVSRIIEIKLPRNFIINRAVNVLFTWLTLKIILALKLPHLHGIDRFFYFMWW